MIKTLLLAGLVTTSSLSAVAETTPPRGDADPRVRIVDYDPTDVVRVTTFYGVSTHIQFGDGEEILDSAVGDVAAWSVIPRRNHLFIKPKETKADTNVTIVTTKRTYQFALVVEPTSMRNERAWKNPNLIYSLTFRYPDEEAAKRQADEQAAKLQERKSDLQSALNGATTEGANKDYWVAGSTEISPTAASDDGRFTYLTFSNNRDMPAIYAVDESGAESLINTTVVGNKIVVQRVVRKLVLRKGTYVACIVSRSFDLDGGKDNISGTVAPTVERVIKGKAP